MYDIGDGQFRESTIPASVLAHDFAFPLTQMNDHFDKSFIEIADWIEANVPEDADGVA